MHDALADRYPISHQLEDGAKITCAIMTHNDREALTKFLTRLSPNDLLYLQVDITQPDIQTMWFDSMAAGRSVGICAFDPAQLVGYASIQLSDDEQLRSGEIRVNISQGYRSRGLGRILISEIFRAAETLKLKTVTARMLDDQYGAKSAFERLGFVKERVLENYVKAQSGEAKNLLVMSSTLH